MLLFTSVLEYRQEQGVKGSVTVIGIACLERGFVLYVVYISCILMEFCGSRPSRLQV